MPCDNLKYPVTKRRKSHINTGKMLASHAGNRGSTPLGDAILFHRPFVTCLSARKIFQTFHRLVHKLTLSTKYGQRGLVDISDREVHPNPGTAANFSLSTQFCCPTSQCPLPPIRIILTLAWHRFLLLQSGLF